MSDKKTATGSKKFGTGVQLAIISKAPASSAANKNADAGKKSGTDDQAGSSSGPGADTHHPDTNESPTKKKKYSRFDEEDIAEGRVPKLD
ncbi:predicted protein [Plenodomus lingam JN3]|uniref:Predicted protein n=1 Tax=Leptosphaeria maculans (strain JN3 / isolate v23.1.3 / race Av1-4-5-6-7-8) TaxID=985895 RepID=E4ZY00_LEPMJ|nr:predicted protein [Plenodomus lingam JN3]CBX96245.1 predicted protein [Plenodomus lingam JN3]